MAATSIHFLSRLQTSYRGGQSEASAAWDRFYDFYGPFIRGWLTKQGVHSADADDIVQDVVCVLLRELPHFRHNGSVGAFRCWLRRVTQHQLRRHRRTHGREQDAGTNLTWLADALTDTETECHRQWDREHDQYLLGKLLRRIRGDFQRSTLAAFERTALEGQSAHDVANDLNLTPAAVIAGKARILCRLREEAAHLLV